MRINAVEETYKVHGTDYLSKIKYCLAIAILKKSLFSPKSINSLIKHACLLLQVESRVSTLDLAHSISGWTVDGVQIVFARDSTKGGGPMTQSESVNVEQVPLNFGKVHAWRDVLFALIFFLDFAGILYIAMNPQQEPLDAHFVHFDEDLTSSSVARDITVILTVSLITIVLGFAWIELLYSFPDEVMVVASMKFGISIQFLMGCLIFFCGNFTFGFVIWIIATIICVWFWLLQPRLRFVLTLLSIAKESSNRNIALLCVSLFCQCVVAMWFCVWVLALHAVAFPDDAQTSEPLPSGKLCFLFGSLLWYFQLYCFAIFLTFSCCCQDP